MSDLRTLPAIRAEAERLACEYWNAVAEQYNAANHPSMCEWRHVDSRIQSYRVEAHLDLLCDLTRPASRDAVARLVAPKIGISLSTLYSDLEHQDYASYGCAHDGIERLFRELGMSVPVTSPPFSDPVEALRLIALHVLGAVDV